MNKSKSKRNIKSVAKKNRLKADFSKELGSKRKCVYCKSYIKYKDMCAIGNKPDSEYICHRFTLKIGSEKEYKNFILNLKNKQ